MMKTASLAVTRILASIFVAAAGCLLSSLLHAEGAVRIFDCKVTQRCDAAGKCAVNSDSIEFRLEPQALADDGSGEYILRYRDRTVPMQAASEAGPFLWSEQNVRYTLLVSSETQLLLHALELATVPATTVDFLTCKVRQ